jgi:pimeloyl-ACP methyl ester carboxylesterase
MITQDKQANPTEFYTWRNYNCSYEVNYCTNTNPSGTPLLLIHAIGVGLSRSFWQRFTPEWYNQGNQNTIYNPDLIGCGESDMPTVAFTPTDWAEQLQYFIEKVIQKPVILVAQGALLPAAIELSEKAPNLVAGIVFAGPPTWSLITTEKPKWQQDLAWKIFTSPFGNLFYRYARTEKFLRNFSSKRLFASADAVDNEWLNTLNLGSQNMASRYAVFSFLAGFWQKGYYQKISQLAQPTLVVMGEKASSIGKKGKQETPDERLTEYLACLPNAEGLKISGRNVLPYESTQEFVRVITPFVKSINLKV